MPTHIFAVSCPKGKDYHDRLKSAFPNLSKKIMDYLDQELIEAESKNRFAAARESWLTKTALPLARSHIGRKDPFDVSNQEMIEMLKPEEITVTEKEAGWLLNRLQNEWCDLNGV